MKLKCWPGWLTAGMLRDLADQFDEMQTENKLMREVLQQIVNAAASDPFNPIGNVIRHVVPEVHAILESHYDFD